LLKPAVFNEHYKVFKSINDCRVWVSLNGPSVKMSSFEVAGCYAIKILISLHKIHDGFASGFVAYAKSSPVRVHPSLIMTGYETSSNLYSSMIILEILHSVDI
jgi:hypothetical protein